MLKKIIVFILLLAILENAKVSLANLRHFNYMDNLDLRFNSIIIKDHFGVTANWRQIFDIYRANKEFFTTARLKTWENVPKDEIAQRLKRWGKVYICNLDGKIEVLTP